MAQLLILSMFVSPTAVGGQTLSGGNVDGAPASAPSVVANDAVIDDSTDSQIEIGYNADGEVALSDLELHVSGPGYGAMATANGETNFQSKLSATSGEATLLVPAETFGGGSFAVDVMLFDASTGELVAEDSFRITDESPVTLESFQVSPTTQTPGDPVSADVTLENTGSSSEDFTVAYYDGGMPVNTDSGTDHQRVTLDSGETQTVSADVVFDTEGTHYLSVNDRPPKEITVTNGAEVTDYTVSQTAAHTHENVTVTTTVANTRDTSVTESFTVYHTEYGFTNERVEEVTLAAGETKTVETTIRYDSAGSSQIWVEGKSGSKTDVGVTENPIEVVDGSFDRTSVQTGETVTATVTVENTGPTEETRVLALDERRFGSDPAFNTVTLAPGETRTVSLSKSLSVPGAHELSVGWVQEKVLVDASGDPVSVTGFSATDVTGSTVYAGDIRAIEATVENTGTSEKTFRVSAWLDDSQIAGETVTVGASSSTTVTLNGDFYKTGSHLQLTVNDQSPISIAIEERATITDRSLSKEVVSPGETVNVEVTYDNPTNKDADSKYLSVWAGEDLGRHVTVPANSQKTVTVPVSFSEVGTHRVWIDDVQEKVFVVEDTTGTPSVGFSDRMYLPDTVVKGSSTYFTVALENDGDASAVQTVNLSVDGTRVTQETVVVPAGQSTYVTLEATIESKGDHSVELEAGEATKSLTVTARDPVVVDNSVTVEHVSGTQPSQLPSVDVKYSGGQLNVDVSDPNGGMDLDAIGADATTEFEIAFTVDSYEPRVMVGTGQGLRWEKTPVDGTDRTTVTIWVKPSRLDFIQFDGDNPSVPSEWDAYAKDDRADFGFDQAVLLGIGNAQGDFFDHGPDVLDGMRVSTDAQMFSMPRYYEGTSSTEPRLEIPLAAPHETTEGTVNQGYYRAYLPQSLLDAWGVTDPESELTGGYSAASDATLTVTDVPGGGATIALDLHYSSGTVSITKRSTTSGGSSGGSRSSTTTSTATPTVTETPTPPETATPTVTATPTPEATPTPVADGTPADAETESRDSATDGSGPGFGALGSLLALLVVGFLARRR